MKNEQSLDLGSSPAFDLRARSTAVCVKSLGQTASQKLGFIDLGQSRNREVIKRLNGAVEITSTRLADLIESY